MAILWAFYYLLFTAGFMMIIVGVIAIGCCIYPFMPGEFTLATIILAIGTIPCIYAGKRIPTTPRK